MATKTKASHTPGPWEWHDRGYDVFDLVHFVPGETFQNGEPRYIRVHSDGSAGGEYSADIDPDGPDGLLIQAAPDLLAACKLIVALDCEPGAYGLAESQAAARAAIAKAQAE